MKIVTRIELRRRIRNYYRTECLDRKSVLRKLRKLCRYFLKRRRKSWCAWAAECEIIQWLAMNLQVEIVWDDVVVCLRQLEESRRIIRDADGRYRYR